MRKLKNSYFITRGDNMNGINYDKFKSPNSLVSQLELIGYISDKLNQRNISCIIKDEFAAEFYTGSFYRAKYIYQLS